MKKALVFIAVAACSAYSVAATTGAVSGKISTLGAGLEYSFPVSDQVDIGLNANYFNYNHTFEEDDLTLDANAKLFTFGAVGYYYPWVDNGFNVNGGLYYNGNEVNIDAKPTVQRTYTFNNRTYSTSDVKDAKGTVEFNKIAPYVGVGWKSGDRNQEGLAFDANLGVMIHGTPNVNFSAKCTGSLAENNSVSKQLCSELQRNIAVERNKVQDDANAFKVYPVASVGFIYRF